MIPSAPYDARAAAGAETPEEMYRRAEAVMRRADTEVAYKAAAKMFAMADGVKDARRLEKRCLEQAEICRKDAIYASAKAHMEENSICGHESAIAQFSSIPGWRDADDLLRRCRETFDDVKINTTKARLTRKRVEEARYGKIERRRKLAIAAVIAVVLAGIAYAVLYVNVIAPYNRYMEADELYRAGKYYGAGLAFEQLGDYRDSAARAAACVEAVKEPGYAEAQRLYENRDYESAIYAFLRLNGYKDSYEKIGACRDVLKDRGFEEQRAALRDAKVGSTVRFGYYEQFSDTGAGMEEIEWQVLDIDESGALLVISRYALDCQFFAYADDDTAWEKSPMRSWLNRSFYEDAFGTAHRQMIVTSTVRADTQTEDGAPAGGDTEDKIFLLSVPEANRYFASDEERQCLPTTYAAVQGAWTAKTFLINGRPACWWWLRSPGITKAHAARVLCSGLIDSTGSSVFTVFNAIRPVMRIDPNAKIT